MIRLSRVLSPLLLALWFVSAAYTRDLVDFPVGKVPGLIRRKGIGTHTQANSVARVRVELSNGTCSTWYCMQLGHVSTSFAFNTSVAYLSQGSS